MTMYKLYIDTAIRGEKSVRLVEVAISGEEKNLDEKTGDIDIVSSIQNILQEHDLAPSDIEEFVPNLGPGSFTGLKTGVTVANILNWANGKRSLEDLDQPEYGADPNITPRKSE